MTKNDFQTPPAVAKYMVSLLPNGIKTVLEPTPGIGNIVQELKLKFNENDTKIYEPENYFDLKKSKYDAIVMNPPFSSKYAFGIPENYIVNGMRFGYQILVECMEMSDIIIAIMPWFTISDSDVRLRFIKKFGLKSITALPRKTFQYARIQTCVLELNKGFSKKTEFKVFDLL